MKIMAKLKMSQLSSQNRHLIVQLTKRHSFFNFGSSLKQLLPNSIQQNALTDGERPLPKYNVNASVTMPKDYYDYENSEVIFGFQDDYEFCAKLGRGRYSEVYRGVNLLNNESCVIKILKPGMFKHYHYY